MTQTSATAPQPTKTCATKTHATKTYAGALTRVIERHTMTQAPLPCGTTAAIRLYPTTKSVQVDSMSMTLRPETISVETTSARTKTPAASFPTHKRLR